MLEGSTIAVLSPFLGGPYFGGILSGVKRAAERRGARVIAIQTLDAGAESADIPGPRRYRHRFGWDQASGFVVIIDAVSPEYLKQLQAAGKPVVVVSHEYPGVECPTVISDNATGVRQVVTHLVEHGHRKIGFAGYLSAYDIKVRYEAYRRTLLEHGIEPDPDLLFDACNNNETGGDQAAERMLATGLPATAVVAATDANAGGIIRTLAAAGFQVPRDLAVVGFDDLDSSAYGTPTLTSVRQPFDTIGATAIDLLGRQLDESRNLVERHDVPTMMILRESCGCPTGAATGPETSDEDPSVQLRHWLTALLAPGGGEEGRAAVEIAVNGIVGVVDNAANGAGGPNQPQLRVTIDRAYRHSMRPEVIGQIAHAVRKYANVVAAGYDAEKVIRIEDCVNNIVLTLAQSQARAQYEENSHFVAALSTQYEVSMDLLRSHEEDPRTLGWLTRTSALGGCLGLWAAHGAHSTDGGDGPEPINPNLEIVGMFLRDRQRPPLPRDICPVAEFPPTPMIELADRIPGAMVFVVPVKVGASDRGALSIVGSIESMVPTGRETINQWGALLTVSLDHESILESLRDQDERLRRAALFDELTGLPNRVLFLDRLRQALTRTRRRPDYHFGVLFLDLDGFKVINDSLGHSAGDRLLIQVAERIHGDLRETDTAARFGGDEFLILLEDIADLSAPSAIADRMHNALRRPFRLEGQDVVVSASIGIALSITGYNDAEDVLRDADIAMYWAKSQEKGTHAIFDVDMHARAVSRLQIEAELRRALEHGELQVYYQPIVDLKTCMTAGFEALIRWQHPTRGLLAPGEFLQVAEESGLTPAMGRWTTLEVCRQLMHWQSTNSAAERLRISLNASNRQFWNAGLLDELDECLSLTGIDPSCLALEITEGVIMRNVDQACKILSEIRERGLELHIDDFGTGYSSLEALHRLAIDALKVDRSFVERLGTDTRSGELVRTIVLMADNLGLELIAEGIETEAQREHLCRLGAQFGQGYWFSRPVPGDSATALITGPLPLGRPGPV